MESKLSQAQVNLIECLKYLQVSQDGIKGIMLMIPNEEQIGEMASFLLENKQATESEMIEKAIEISERA